MRNQTHFNLIQRLYAKDDEKLSQRLKSGFTRTSFQGINRFFVFSFENNNDRTGHTRYILPKLEMKDYNVMIDGQNLFEHYKMI